MTVVSCDGLSFSGLAWISKMQPSKLIPAYGMLGPLLAQFRDHCMVLLADEV